MMKMMVKMMVMILVGQSVGALHHPTLQQHSPGDKRLESNSEAGSGPSSYILVESAFIPHEMKTFLNRRQPSVEESWKGSSLAITNAVSTTQATLSIKYLDLPVMSPVDGAGNLLSIEDDPIPSNTLNIDLESPPSKKNDSLVHWHRLKSVVSNMRSILIKLYEDEEGSVHVPMMAIDKALVLGDYISLTSNIFYSLDSELQNHLYSLLSKFEEDSGKAYPILSYIFSKIPSSNDLRDSWMPWVLVKLGHFLHNQAMNFAGELDFVEEMMRSSGFLPEEVHLIFKLLDLPLTPGMQDEQNKPRQSRQIQGRFSDDIGFRRDGGYGGSGGFGHSGGGGYGHSGGYGNSGGYGGAGSASGGYGHSGGGGGGGHSSGGYGGYMQYMRHDPFVILAGLGFLTLCSYVTFLILSSKASKRSIPEYPLTLDLSDIPYLQQLVHNAHHVYEQDKEVLEGATGELPGTLNTLWRSYTNATAATGEVSCLKRALCYYLRSPTASHGLLQNQPLLGPQDSFRQLLVLSLAHVLGVGGTGRSADDVNTLSWAAEEEKQDNMGQALEERNGTKRKDLDHPSHICAIDNISSSLSSCSSGLPENITNKNIINTSSRTNSDGDISGNDTSGNGEIKRNNLSSSKFIDKTKLKISSKNKLGLNMKYK